MILAASMLYAAQIFVPAVYRNWFGVQAGTPARLQARLSEATITCGEAPVGTQWAARRNTFFCLTAWELV